MVFFSAQTFNYGIVRKTLRQIRSFSPLVIRFFLLHPVRDYRFCCTRTSCDLDTPQEGSDVSLQRVLLCRFCVPLSRYRVTCVRQAER